MLMRRKVVTFTDKERERKRKKTDKVSEIDRKTSWRTREIGRGKEKKK